MVQNINLSIRNFGPVKAADIDFGEITAIIGPQGSGNGLIARLLTLFSNLENGLSRHSMTAEELQREASLKRRFANSTESHPTSVMTQP